MCKQGRQLVCHQNQLSEFSQPNRLADIIKYLLLIEFSFHWHEKLLHYPYCPVLFISACLCYRVTLIDDSGSAWQSYNIRTISQEEYDTQMLAKIAAVLGKCSLILIDIRSRQKR